MLANHEIEKLAAEFARDIVVARAPNFSIHTNSAGGKSVAEFYAAIYKGIVDVLTDTSTTKSND